MKNEAASSREPIPQGILHLRKVPVYRAHSISLSAEFSCRRTWRKSTIEGFNGAELWDLPNANRYPTPLQYAEKEDCGVGRIRIDQAFDNGLSLWVVGDQLWKGAALNAIQIAETLVEKKCLKWM